MCTSLPKLDCLLGLIVMTVSFLISKPGNFYSSLAFHFPPFDTLDYRPLIDYTSNNCAIVMSSYIDLPLFGSEKPTSNSELDGRAPMGALSCAGMLEHLHSVDSACDSVRTIAGVSELSWVGVRFMSAVACINVEHC